MFSLEDQRNDKKAFSSQSIDLMILKPGAFGGRGRQTDGGVTQMSHGTAFYPVLSTKGNLPSFLAIGKLPIVSGSISQVPFQLDIKCKLKL